MPRAKRHTDAEAFKPLISFEQIAYEKVSFKLSEPIIANLKAYAAYVQASTSQQPTLDEIVSKGMQRLFDADKGFRNWLHQQNGTNHAAEKELPANAAESDESFGNALSQRSS